MGSPDSVFVPCPQCKTESEFQSKGADEPSCRVFKLVDCPADVMSDINRHAPLQCEKCGTWFLVQFDIEQKVSNVRVVAVNAPEEPD